MNQLQTLQAINAEWDGNTICSDATNEVVFEKKEEEPDIESCSVESSGGNHKRVDMKNDDVDPGYTDQMREYRGTIKRYEFFGKFFGQQASYTWKPGEHLVYWYTFFLLGSAWLGIIYTVLYHCHHGEYSRVTEPLSIVGMSTSCFCKWVCQVLYARKMYSLWFFTKKLCLLNVHGARANILRDGLNLTNKMLNVFAFCIVGSLTILFSVPLYAFIQSKEWMPLMPIEFPFINQKTASGYILAQSVLLGIVIYGNFDSVMFGLGFIISIRSYTYQVQMIAEDFKELDKMWGDPTTTTTCYRYAYLSNICMKLQDMNSYLDTIKDMFQLKFVIFFFANWVAQVICLYEVMSNWIGAGTIAFIEFLEMFSYCHIGTQLTTDGDRLCEIVYSSNWYEYDLKSQALVQMMLHDSQQSKEIMLGTLGPMNVVTGVTLTKSIYTLLTVLLETM